MKIALIIENSQAAKSDIVHSALKSVVEPLGHTVHHYGMYTPEDKASLTYVMNGLLAGILLNSKAADFVVTGCGTGMGSVLHELPGRRHRQLPARRDRGLTPTAAPPSGATIGIGGLQHRRRPCHTTRRAGPHRAVREFEVRRVWASPAGRSTRWSTRS
jgi:hypothetical protein